MINSMDSIQYIMDVKKAHNEIGYIGLGIMGKPMVRNLITAKHKVVFYARKANVIKEISSIGGRYVDNIPEISKSCKIIFLNLPDSNDVHEVIFSKTGLVSNLSKGSIIIHEKDLDPIKKVYNQNLIKIKQITNWAK